ncbi:Aldo/keto reductase [Peniophora sp. CONT]|nr:Aldo/keto reductase [Peniophora sp. CONT]
MSATKIIYGTAWKKEKTKALVVSAVLSGFRAIDTACQLKHYREDLVGEALQTLYDGHGFKREDLWIQTKFTSISGQDRSQPLPYNPSDALPKQIASSFAKSLSNLRTSYLDSYILHSPMRTYKETLEAWRVLTGLAESGQVKQIGLSNVYDAQMLERLVKDSGRKVDVVQDRWFEGNGWDTEVVEWCRRNGVQYQSFWTLTGSPSLVGSRAVANLAREKGCSAEEIVYRFAQSVGVTPLSGTTSEAHMKADVAVEKIELGEEEVKALNELIV